METSISPLRVALRTSPPRHYRASDLVRWHHVWVQPCPLCRRFLQAGFACVARRVIGLDHPCSFGPMSFSLISSRAKAHAADSATVTEPLKRRRVN